MLLEMIICILHSPPYIDFTYFVTHRLGAKTDYLKGQYSMDQAMMVLSLAKLYFILKVIQPLATSMNAEYSRRVSEYKGINLDFKFYVKIALL